MGIYSGLIGHKIKIISFHQRRGCFQAHHDQDAMGGMVLGPPTLFNIPHICAFWYDTALSRPVKVQ